MDYGGRPRSVAAMLFLPLANVVLTDQRWGDGCVVQVVDRTFRQSVVQSGSKLSGRALGVEALVDSLDRLSVEKLVTYRRGTTAD